MKLFSSLQLLLLPRHGLAGAAVSGKTHFLEWEVAGVCRKCTRKEKLSLNWPVAMIWETPNSWGDDEYRVRVLDTGNEILYSSSHHSNDEGPHEITDIKKSKSGDGYYYPAVVCDLEDHDGRTCEGPLNIVMVSCGCPADKPDRLEECVLDKNDFGSSRPAVCTDGLTSDATIFGEWRQVGSGPDLTFKATYGTVLTTRKATTETEERSIVETISAGVSYKAVSISASLTKEESSSVAHEVESSLAVMQSEEYEVRCPSENSSTGLWHLWQWVMTQEANERGPGFTSKTQNFICTESLVTKPCCPLGLCGDVACKTCLGRLATLPDLQMCTPPPPSLSPTPLPSPSPTSPPSLPPTLLPSPSPASPASPSLAALSENGTSSLRTGVVVFAVGWGWLACFAGLM